MRTILFLAVAFVLATTACDAPVVDTTSTAPPGGTNTGVTTAAPVASDESPLVAEGCGVFDPIELGRLTSLGLPLALVQEDSRPDALTCSFVGTADDIDASVRVEVRDLASRADGYYRTAGEFESPLEVGGFAGVGTGRGSLRAELHEIGGLTVTVGIRTLSADARSVSDGEHLDIRDAVAAYVVDRLT